MTTHVSAATLMRQQQMFKVDLPPPMNLEAEAEYRKKQDVKADELRQKAAAWIAAQPTKGNDERGPELTPEELAECVHTAPARPFLYMGKIGMTIEGVSAIAGAMMVDKTITHLDLSGNELGDAGAIEIAAMLKRTKTLKHLNLVDNEIGVEGASALADAIRVNRSLVVVDMSSNKVGIQGTQALADAVYANDNIEFLNLAETATRHPGARIMVDAREERGKISIIPSWKRKVLGLPYL
jgi:Ran GTPase-activating protein (RanGAP) involved in mRNA processing and transport